MRQRCEKETCDDYKYYGAKGVNVCDRWQVYENFESDMGKRPSPKHSIDRSDTTGNYEPSNCRWATSKEQQNNRRNNVRFEGKTQAEWAVELGIDQSVISRRLKKHGTIHIERK